MQKLTYEHENALKMSKMSSKDSKQIERNRSIDYLADASPDMIMAHKKASRSPDVKT